MIVTGDSEWDRREVARGGLTCHLPISRRIDFPKPGRDQRKWPRPFYQSQIDAPAGDLGRCRRGLEGGRRHGIYLRTRSCSHNRELGQRRGADVRFRANTGRSVDLRWMSAHSHKRT